MRQFRLVALLPLLGAAACYSDAPAQSTFPDQQQYVSGPPGGGMDPEPATAPAAGDPADEAGTDQVLGSDSAPSERAPEAAIAGPSEPPSSDAADPDEDEGVQGGLVGPAGPSAPGVAQAPSADPASAPTASVTDAEIDATLQGYGQWIENDDYGEVWRPDATVVGVDFTPYDSGGSWAYTAAGWGFNCDYGWGWLPFHYGRWAWFHDYWGWVPGHRWSPAWVDWRHGGGVVGWRPTPPRVRDHRGGEIRDHRHGGGNLIRDHRHAETHDAHWRFAATTDFARPHIRAHLYRNPAEGLRVTTRVAAPPLRARTTLHAGDLMRNRTQATQGIRQNPRYQAYGPQRPYAPTETWRRPTGIQRSQPYPPGRVYQPGVPSQQPGRTWQGRPDPSNPGRVSPQPGRPAQPPGRFYQPPTRAYQPPTRAYQPSSRPFTPSTPAGAPSRSWAPPAAPPSRSFAPPAAPPSHGSSPSSGGGGHSSSAPSGGHSSSGNSGGGGHSSRH
jgi:uncharacterized membrane protein YgcG